MSRLERPLLVVAIAAVAMLLLYECFSAMTTGTDPATRSGIPAVSLSHYSPSA